MFRKVFSLFLVFTFVIGKTEGAAAARKQCQDQQGLADGNEEDKSFSLIMEQLVMMEQNRSVADMLQEHMATLRSHRADNTPSFNCDVSKRDVGGKIPSSVHTLRPRDVKIVAALGDSLTAANGAGANTLAGVILNYRGVSWSIGGDETIQSVLTLPNIIRQFSPTLVGYSEGVGFRWQPSAGFNVAKAGAIAQDMPGQAQLLIDKLEGSSDIDYRNDWKVITLFVGGNNLCRYCLNRDKHKPENYIASVKEALDILHSEVPRAFVNLVTTIDVQLTKELSVGTVCAALHAVACSCGAYENFADREEMDEVTEAYRSGLRDLVRSGRYDTREDFTVVIQPFLDKLALPTDNNGEADLSYLAPDCFHFSTKAHAQGAVGLWNSMLEPIDEKPEQWIVGEAIKCPTEERPYLFTNKNSGAGVRHKVKWAGGVASVSDHESYHAVAQKDEGSFRETENVVLYVLGGVATITLFTLIIAIILIKRYQHVAQRNKNNNNKYDINNVILMREPGDEEKY